MLKIVGVKEAAERLGLSVRVLEAHLQSIGPVDEHGNPYYRMTPGRGKRLFSEEQLEMIWESLPQGIEVPKINITLPDVTRRGRRSMKARSAEQSCHMIRMAETLERRIERERREKKDTKYLERFVAKLRKEAKEKGNA
ncbi:hypothetical protein [Hwanghaeella sp.]|uniref:hypothetical protein n=1 Tax=Hwanghaeella sp. TaxID=2605943 RepID=UPI003CCB7C1C